MLRSEGSLRRVRPAEIGQSHHHRPMCVSMWQFSLAVVMHPQGLRCCMKVLSWINFILGLWLIFAGFTMGRGVPAVMTEEIILGIIIAALSLAVLRTGNTVLSWVVALAGLWTLLAPAVVNYTAVPRARGNDITVGVIVLILGVVNALYRPAAVRTHI